MYVRFFKRIVDLFFVFLGLPFFCLLFLFVAPMIILDDGYPIFYNAYRIGQNGKLFKMYKFRSMRSNAPDIRLADGSTYNSDNDPRVTRVGKFLRKTSVDEIPQLINVLFGDMSIVGPRPNLPTLPFNELPKIEKERLKVKPGITGFNQAYYRNSVDVKTKYENDLYYVANISAFFDIKIILKTISTVLKRKNINITENGGYIK